MGIITQLIISVCLCVVAYAHDGVVHLFGGSTAISSFADDLMRGFSANSGIYEAVGSSTGIAGLLADEINYRVAASDDPLSTVQDSIAKTLGGQVTAPIAITSYSFMTRKKSGLTLSAQAVYNIYFKKWKTWRQVKSGLSGNIVAVARNDIAGITKSVDTWLVNHVKWRKPSTYRWSNFIPSSASVVYVAGTNGMTRSLTNPNAIGYIETGTGLTARIYDIGLLNPAGSYIFASKTDRTFSIPTNLPPGTSSWSGITLINTRGKNTYPITTFVYSIGLIKRSLKVGRLFMLYMQSPKAQALTSTKYNNNLTPIPSRVRDKSIRYIKLIKD